MIRKLKTWWQIRTNRKVADAHIEMLKWQQTEDGQRLTLLWASSATRILAEETAKLFDGAKGIRYAEYRLCDYSSNRKFLVRIELEGEIGE